ncbi:hypothetical protein DERP_011860 [Dermatophagoides pteronyssinus]|uniref:Uncharacterized protein n=1 Tax=Dermatophagoides pteronyssinus TaxID=6956 RepID=A0ABQ8JRG8_DERPT|nr:hypothetical protein DERP_011860 [Dermatophagoides pteronyssinus]
MECCTNTSVNYHDYLATNDTNVTRIPHALQTGSPELFLRHNVVDVVLQFEHVNPTRRLLTVFLCDRFDGRCIPFERLNIPHALQR